MTLAEEILKMVEAARERPRLGSSELSRRSRARLRRQTGGTLVKLTAADLFKIVKNRKELLGSEMGEFRTTKLTRVVPNPRSKSITFQAEAYSPGDPKKGIRAQKYKPQIVFYSVDMIEEKDKKHPLSVSLKDGDLLWSEQMKSFKHPCQVMCTCMDFHFRWGWYDADKRALLGANRKKFAYTRKTPPPPAGYPYVNPKNLPGYCKHIHTLLLSLQKRRILI